MTSRRATALSVVVLIAALLLGACGSSGSSGSSDPELGESLDASTTTADSDATTTTESSSGTAEGPFVDGGSVFEDPQGTYVIDVDPAWETGAGPTSEIEVWFIGSGDDQFRNNVNVLTQDTQGRDLQEYMDYSAQNLGGLTLISSNVETGAAGNEIGIIEYTGTIAGAPIPLHVVATVIVEDGQAAVATLTTTLDTFADSRAAVEPFLRTLRPVA